MTQITSAELNRQLVDDYLDHMVMRNMSPQTVLQYGALLGVWLDFVDIDLRRATPELATDFVRRPRGRRAHGQIGAPATRNRDLAILSSFYSWLIDVGEIEKNPMRLAPRAKVRNRKAKALDDKTFLRAYEAANATDKLWLGLGFYCGFRAAEIVSLSTTQIVDGIVANFVRKGGHEDTWPLDEVLGDFRERSPHLGSEDWREVLRSRLDHGDSGPLCDFVGYRTADTVLAARRYGSELHYRPTVLNKRLARVVQAAGVTEFTPHALRHSAITNWLGKLGYPLHIVQVLAAHSSAEVTARYMAGSKRMLADWRGGKVPVRHSEPSGGVTG